MAADGGRCQARPCRSRAGPSSGVVSAAVVQAVAGPSSQRLRTADNQTLTMSRRERPNRGGQCPEMLCSGSWERSLMVRMVARLMAEVTPR